MPYFRKKKRDRYVRSQPVALPILQYYSLFLFLIENEDLRKAFAAEANVLGPWIEATSEQIANLGLQVEGTLEVGA